MKKNSKSNAVNSSKIRQRAKELATILSEALEANINKENVVADEISAQLTACTVLLAATAISAQVPDSVVIASVVEHLNLYKEFLSQGKDVRSKTY